MLISDIDYCGIFIAQVHVRTSYPTCCGMPQLEQGNVAEVVNRASKIAKELCAYAMIMMLIRILTEF